MMALVEYGFISLEARLRRQELEPMTEEQRLEMRERAAHRLTTVAERRDDLNKEIRDLRVTLEALDID